MSINKEIQDIIQQDEYLYSYRDDQFFITIFSQKHYDLNDYEITTKVQRDYLARKLKDLSYKWTRGNELSSKQVENKIIFPKFRYREFYPKKEISRISNKNLIVLSPTLLAVHIILTQDEPKEFLIDLIHYQPINYQKIAKLLPDFHELLKEIGLLQEELLRQSPLIYRQELDTTF